MELFEKIFQDENLLEKFIEILVIFVFVFLILLARIIEAVIESKEDKGNL